MRFQHTKYEDVRITSPILQLGQNPGHPAFKSYALPPESLGSQLKNLGNLNHEFIEGFKSTTVILRNLRKTCFSIGLMMKDKSELQLHYLVKDWQY